MRARNIAVIVVLAAAAVAVVWWRTWSHPEQPTSSAATPTAIAAAPARTGSPVRSEAELLNQIIREGVTPERAKLLFSIEIGKLPGVDVPAGLPRDTSRFDGTPAATYLMGVWESLTQEQRDASAKYLHLPSSASAGLMDQSDRVVRASFAPDRKDAYTYDKFLDLADGTLSAVLGQPRIRYAFDVDYDNYPPNGTTHALTLSWNAWEIIKHDWMRTGVSDCHVLIFNRIFQKGVPTADDARSVMLHEMMHCYQQRVIEDFTTWQTAPAWVKEGEATWAQVAAVPEGTNVVQKLWTMYSTSPATAYMDRSEDALGVFGHLSDLVGADAVWARLLAVMNRAPPGKAQFDLTPFDLLIQGNDDAYYSSWGASYFLTSGKKQWTMTTPGYPPTSGLAPQKLQLSNDTPTLAEIASPFNARTVELSGSVDVAVVALLAGYGRVHDSGFGVDQRLDTSGSVGFCVKPGGCTCPDQSPGASLHLKKATLPLSVGLESASSGAQLLVIGHSLDLHCKQRDDPKQLDPGGGGGGGGGTDQQDEKRKRGDPGSGGDTHILTFDGLKYDFQVVGEYTLAKSTKDDFVLQARQGPVRQSRTVTVNQALATRLGGKRVTVTLENDVSVLRIDGQTIGDEIPPLPSGSITRSDTVYGTTYLFEWPDSTTVRVEQLGRRALNVHVKPSASRKGRLAGLLGDDNGSPANDLIGMAGAPLGVTPDPQLVTHSLADAWRVPQSASLFDYLPGQSTATFTDPTFPDALVDPSRVPNRAEAERRCRQSGITDERLLDNCILDYGLTSDFLFVHAYGHEQQALAARARFPLAVAGGGVSPGVLKLMTMAGTVTDKRMKPSFSFQAQAGDVLWIGDPDCMADLPISLVDPSGKSLSGGRPCGLGRVVLRSAGTYLMRTPPAYEEVPLVSYRVPIRVLRPDRRSAVKYGDVISGRIETRGAHDLYSFEGHEGDVLRFSGEGCLLDGLVVAIIAPRGWDALGPSCRGGSDFVLRETGTHQILINSTDGAEGPYHFLLQGAKSK